jgi:hypothetical protein
MRWYCCDNTHQGALTPVKPVAGAAPAARVDEGDYRDPLVPPVWSTENLAGDVADRAQEYRDRVYSSPLSS